jgi:hypothetical protein
MVHSKMKKALSLTKEESFFVNFARWFQLFAKSANDLVTKIGSWYSTVMKIFRGEVECSLEEAEKILSSSNGRSILS